MAEAKLRIKPTKNDSVFFDFRVYRAFVNTEIKEHGNALKICSVCQEFSLSNSLVQLGANKSQGKHVIRSHSGRKATPQGEILWHR